MFIIGHKAAAGIAPENTLEGISSAIKCRVNAIEIDVRMTSDNRFVLCHDSSLLQKTGKLSRVCDLTLKEIQLTTTNSGHPIPTLEEAIEEAEGTILVIDCKGNNWAKSLTQELSKYDLSKFYVSSSNHRELIRFSLLCPSVETYASAWGHAFDALYLAKQAGLTGVSLSYGLYNPATYLFARRAKLKMIMFNLNHSLAARLMHALYPRAMITTDFPNKFSDLMSKKGPRK